VSSTRNALDPAELRQERFSSSTELRGDFLLGNLVAKRTSVLNDPEKRRLCWFVQDVSTRQGVLTHPTCNQFAAWPFTNVGDTGASGLELLASEILFRSKAEATSERLRIVKDWLARLALDPTLVAFDVAGPICGLRDPLGTLSEIMADLNAVPLGRAADTLTKKKVFDLLDYCLESRGLVLATGTYRVGKSFSAQAWAQSHLGVARYVQLTSARDDEAFFRQIARSIGVACSLKRKAAEIRERVEATLQHQQIMLIFDEAQYCLPQTVRTSQLPQRLCWIITALLNRNVPVALIASRDWTRIVQNMKRTLPIFGFEQLEGRQRLRVDLPDVLSEHDLTEIARIFAPDADEASLMLLAGLAMRHSGYIATTIEAVVARARFLARKHGSAMTFESIKAAMTEIDPSFRPHRDPGANPSRGGGAAAADASRITTFDTKGRPKHRKTVLFSP